MGRSRTIKEPSSCVQFSVRTLTKWRAWGQTPDPTELEKRVQEVLFYSGGTNRARATIMLLTLVPWAYHKLAQKQSSALSLPKQVGQRGTRTWPSNPQEECGVPEHRG